MASRPKHLREILIVVLCAIVVLPFILWLSTLFGPAIWVREPPSAETKKPAITAA